MSKKLFKCQNCARLWPEGKLIYPFPDVFERVAPGEFMPAGECPACGAVCHPALGYPIWVVVVERKHGMSTYFARTEQRALDQLEAYVDSWWSQEIGENVATPGDQAEKIAEYFAAVAGRESYELEEGTL